MDKAEFLIRKGYGDMIEGMSPIEIEELFNSVTGTFTAANTYRKPGNQGGRIGYAEGTSFQAWLKQLHGLNVEDLKASDYSKFASEWVD